MTVGATFLDRDGAAKPLIMGCYGIGTGRLMASVIEQHHDGKGIIWPVAIAPFQVHVVSLGTNDPEVVAAAERLCERLTKAGYEVLYDDRSESAGVKFNDADLIGIPVRLTVSRRTIKSQSVELKARWAEGVAARSRGGTGSQNRGNPGGGAHRERSIRGGMMSTALKDRDILRALAEQVAQIAALPVHAQTIAGWKRNQRVEAEQADDLDQRASLERAQRQR